MIGSEREAQEWLRSQMWCDPEAFTRLTRLVEMLRAENEHQNLVSNASLAQVWQRHVCDSAQLLRFVPRGTNSTFVNSDVPRETFNWLDLGSGAGFPGLVVACLMPAIRVILVEARKKRIEWLELATNRLQLPHCIVRGERLESVPTVDCDVISARAFAPLPRLLDAAARFSTPETTWLLPKGRSAKTELGELRGWDHKFHVEPSISDDQSGIIVGTLSGRKGGKR